MNDLLRHFKDHTVNIAPAEVWGGLTGAVIAGLTIAWWAGGVMNRSAAAGGATRGRRAVALLIGALASTAGGAAGYAIVHIWLVVSDHFAALTHATGQVLR